jgi:uncharacterized membrane protein
MLTIAMFGQQPLELSILKGAENPNSMLDNYYLLQVVNKSQTVYEFTISATNTACTNTNYDLVELKQKVLNRTKSGKLIDIKLQKGESKEFYLKIYRDPNTRTNTWNCTEVKAILNDSSQISNALTIESLIPSSQNGY